MCAGGREFNPRPGQYSRMSFSSDQVSGKVFSSEHNNNHNTNITSMALKSPEARAQKRNKTKSVIMFKSRGYTGVIISFKGPRLFMVEKQF